MLPLIALLSPNISFAEDIYQLLLELSLKMPWDRESKDKGNLPLAED